MKAFVIEQYWYGGRGAWEEVKAVVVAESQEEAEAAFKQDEEYVDDSRTTLNIEEIDLTLPFVHIISTASN